MILYNPTKSEQKFLYGAYPYVFKPKESRTLPDEVAIWAMDRGNRNLVKYDASYDREMTQTDMVYSEIEWNKLKTLASNRKLFKPGMTRVALEKALEEYDSAGRTLPQSSN
jgi:hypothetical protein